MFLPYFDVLRDLLLNRCTATWNAFVLYNKETNFYSSFISKSFSVTRKPAFATNTRKAVWRNDLLFIKAISLVALRIKGLWLVHKNHATVKLIQMAYRGMKRNESRIELRNLQILKKKKSYQFLSSEQPCEPKSLDVALNITGVERMLSKNLLLRSTLEAI